MKPAKFIEFQTILKQIEIDFTVIYNYEDMIRDAQANGFLSILCLSVDMTLNSQFIKIIRNINRNEPKWDAIFCANSHRYKDICRKARNFAAPSFKAFALKHTVYNRFLDDQNEFWKDDTLKCLIPNVLLTTKRIGKYNTKTFLSTEKLPMIHVHMKVLNSLLTIDNAIQSILNQDYTNFILILDTSEANNDCKKVCEKYVKQYKKVKVKDSADADVSECVWIVNTIDNCYFHSTRLSLILMTGEDIVYSRYEMISEEKNLLNKLKYKEEPNFRFQNAEYVDDPIYLEQTIAKRNGTTHTMSFLTNTLCYYEL